MTFDSKKAYTIQCKSLQNKIELKSIKPIENWYRAKVVSKHLTGFLQEQLDEIDKHVKLKDFKSVKRLESELNANQFIISELEQGIAELQLSKKDVLYFKLG